jgi:hypothetical protein
MVNHTKPNPTHKPGYQSYLLRLWRENGEDWSWRLSLQDTHTGERIGFACLEDLLRFLSDKTQSIPSTHPEGESGR